MKRIVLFLVTVLMAVSAFAQGWEHLSENYEVKTIEFTKAGRTIVGYDGLAIMPFDTAHEVVHLNRGLSKELRVLSSVVTDNNTIFVGTADFRYPEYALKRKGIFRYDNLKGFVLVKNLNRVWAMVDNSEGHIFAGNEGEGAGIFRSTDDGVSWTKVFGDSSFINIRELVVSSNDVIYAASFGQGVLVSKDNGDSWNLLPRPTDYCQISSIATVETMNGLLAADRWNGIYYYSNNYQRWEPVGLNDLKPQIKVVAVSPTGRLFAGDDQGNLYQTVNDVPEWERVGIDPSDRPSEYSVWNTSVNKIVFDPQGNLLVGTVSGLYRYEEVRDE